MIVRVAGREIPADPRAVLGAVRSEAMSLPRPAWAWLGVLGILLLIGALAAVRSLFPGDKGIATTPTFEWGLLIVGYVFFAITTSGLCLASSLGTVFGIERFRPLERRHAILAVLCLVTAFGIIALDLHYPVRLLFGAVLNPSPSSPMWWMGVFYGIYLCFLLTECWSMFRGHPQVHQVACLLSSCMAIVAPSTLGAVFGVLAARPFWYGAFTPLLMVASALLSGTALLGIVFCTVGRLHLTGFERAATLAIPAIRMLLALALVTVAVLIARQVIAGLGGDPGLERSTRALLDGPLAVPFWGLRVIGGLVLPLLLVLLPWTRTATGLVLAAALSIVGVFADRFLFVAAGQIAPATAVAGVVSTPCASYVPSPVEIGILAGAIGFVAFTYTLAERYLDLGEKEAHPGLLAWSRWRGHLLRPAPVAVSPSLPVAPAGPSIAPAERPMDEPAAPGRSIADTGPLAPVEPAALEAVIFATEPIARTESVAFLKPIESSDELAPRAHAGRIALVEPIDRTEPPGHGGPAGPAVADPPQAVGPVAPAPDAREDAPGPGLAPPAAEDVR